MWWNKSLMGLLTYNNDCHQAFPWLPVWMHNAWLCDIYALLTEVTVIGWESLKAFNLFCTWNVKDWCNIIVLFHLGASAAAWSPHNDGRKKQLVVPCFFWPVQHDGVHGLDVDRPCHGLDQQWVAGILWSQIVFKRSKWPFLDCQSWYFILGHYPFNVQRIRAPSDNFSFQNNGIKKCTCWKTMCFWEKQWVLGENNVCVF